VNKCQLEKSKKLYSGTGDGAGQVGEIPEIFVGFLLRHKKPDDAATGEILLTNRKGERSTRLRSLFLPLK
jgi:hypothetical protein